MARLSSQGAKFMLEDLSGAAPTPIVASAATKAKPAVVTLADVTAITPGNAVRITGSGFKSIDGLVFVAGTVASGPKTVVLLGSNTSAETGTWVATASLVKPTVVEACLATFNRSAGTAASIDVTTLCDTARRKVGGLADTGTFTFDGFYDVADLGYRALLAASIDGKERAMGIVMTDTSAIWWPGTISGIGEAVGVDQAVTFSGTGNVNGPVTYSGIPPTGMTLLAEQEPEQAEAA